MSLTQTQIDECGEAFNAAMNKPDGISTELRGRLVIDVQSATHAVGNAELIAGIKKTIARGAYVDSLNAYLKILESGASAPSSPPPQTPAPSQQTPAPSVPVSEGVNGIFREIWLRAGAIVHSIINSENDGGLGICMNFSIPFGWRKGSTHTDPRKPQIVQRFEQDGVWSVSIGKSDLVPNPTTYEELTPGEWDYDPNKATNRAGKDLGVRGLALDGRKSRNIEIFCGVPGRVVDIAAVPSGGTPNSPTGYRLRLDSERGIYEIAPDGSERKL